MVGDVAANPATPPPPLAWAEVQDRPRFGYVTLILCSVLLLATAVAALLQLAVVPAAVLQQARIGSIVVSCVMTLWAVSLLPLVARRWRDRRLLLAEIARMRAGELPPPHRAAELAWQWLSDASFTPERLEALEADWRVRLPRSWVVRPAPPAWFDQLLMKLEKATGRRAYVPKPLPPTMWPRDRRRLAPVLAGMLLALVLGIAGPVLYQRFPLPGTLCTVLAFIVMFGAGGFMHFPPWLAELDGAAISLRCARRSFWSRFAPSSPPPTLTVNPDRDVLIIRHDQTPKPQNGQVWFRWHIAVHRDAVPAGAPTDFIGFISSVPPESPLHAPLRAAGSK
jgi:hypothetical protein